MDVCPLEVPTRPSLTRAAVVIVLDVNIDWVLEVAAELLRLLLRKGVPGNHCVKSVGCDGRRAPLQHTLEGLFDINRFLGARLKVRDAALGLTESHGPLSRDLRF